MIIAFVGPDGCGKTSLIDALMVELAVEGPVHLREMNFGILPRISDIRLRLTGRPPSPRHEPGAYLAGMSRMPHVPHRAAVYILYYSFDYLLGRPKMRALSRTGTVLFSRYAFDYFYQYAFMHTPRPLRYLPSYCALNPELIVTIDRRAEDIHAAKPELSVAEIRRQQREIDALLAGRQNYLKVDGSRGVEAARDAVLTHLRTLKSLSQ